MSHAPEPHDPDGWPPARSWPAFLLLTVLLLWVAHAIGFFAHEYAHSTLAWLLGWKSNPLALDYGHLTFSNLLAQFDIDENVDYAPIFASGHNHQAGLIAVAGVALGNGLITYPLSLWALATSKRHNSASWAFLSYWILVASVGNFLCYVPIRVFSLRADMHTTAIGFDCSPWWILLVLGLPFGLALIHFLVRIEPHTLRWLLPDSTARRAVLVVLTALALFAFYGAAGWSSGTISHRLSETSVYLLFPLMTLVGWLLTNRIPVKGREA
jgi:hypothetical protein